MHLRSISLKGFKSFPDRTKLDFTPGVSVIVGPNGSGKSNVTDAVLWALGEQSPLAVRGQSMQDVIFAGGHGLPSRNAAEVEVVIDNGDGGLPSEFSEISIVRKLDRSGEGEYRLNGARCRLVDVIDALSDTGLGKEMHSVVSQGRVEGIIHSKPRDRRLLIEEAAGLGKHRKRRRRAQLKLERTADNLARALDVEREARSRLRPLKRQAEAAELHARIERQSLEARLELARDALGSSSRELAVAEEAAAAARAARDEAETALTAVGARRAAAEEAFAAQSRVREALSGRVHAARSAFERIGMRLERARDVGRAATEGAARRGVELEALLAAEREAPPADAGAERIAEIEAELAALAADRERRLPSSSPSCRPSWKRCARVRRGRGRCRRAPRRAGGGRAGRRGRAVRPRRGGSRAGGGTPRRSLVRRRARDREPVPAQRGRGARRRALARRRAGRRARLRAGAGGRARAAAARRPGGRRRFRRAAARLGPRRRQRAAGGVRRELRPHHTSPSDPRRRAAATRSCVPRHPWPRSPSASWPARGWSSRSTRCPRASPAWR